MYNERNQSTNEMVTEKLTKIEIVKKNGKIIFTINRLKNVLLRRHKLWSYTTYW